MADTDPKNPTDPKDPQDPKDPKEPKEPTEPKDPQEPQDPNVPKKDPVPYDEFAKARAERKEALDKLKAIEDADKARKEEEMKKNQEFEKLAEEKTKEAEEAKAKYETSNKKVRFAELALKEGVVDVNDAFRLANLDGVTVSDDGTVSGMEDVIEKLKAEKKYLFGSQDQSLGGGSTPPKDGDTQNGKRIYKQSQVEDPEFYAKNKEDIIKAYQEGRVVNE